MGMKKDDIKLVPYTDDWERLFAEECRLLNLLVGDHIVEIQHIGSTAIKDIYSKPIIDILIGVHSMNDVDKFDSERLKSEGYYHLQRVEIEGKIVFAKFTDLEIFTKTHILHVVEHKAEWWNKHIYFRDFLNNNLNARKEYEHLKMRLASQYPCDEGSYTNEKKPFVDGILTQMVGEEDA